MKAIDFNLPKEINFSFEDGEVTFKNNRLILFDVNAIGLLRHHVIERLGMHEARKLFLKFGYINGYSDYMQLKSSYKFDNELELISAGPVIHSWEGVVKAMPNELRFDRSTGEFYFSGVWVNAYEAEQHLTFYEFSKEPVCWSLMGYSAGYSSAFFGSKLISIEPLCVGKGDDHCEWLIQPPDAWDYKVAKPYIEALQEFK